MDVPPTNEPVCNPTSGGDTFSRQQLERAALALEVTLANLCDRLGVPLPTALDDGFENSDISSVILPDSVAHQSRPDPSATIAQDVQSERTQTSIAGGILDYLPPSHRDTLLPGCLSAMWTLNDDLLANAFAGRFVSPTYLGGIITSPLPRPTDGDAISHVHTTRERLVEELGGSTGLCADQGSTEDTDHNHDGNYNSRNSLRASGNADFPHQDAEPISQDSAKDATTPGQDMPSGAAQDGAQLGWQSAQTHLPKRGPSYDGVVTEEDISYMPGTRREWTAYNENLSFYGPCSKVWDVPKRTRQRKRRSEDTTATTKRARDKQDIASTCRRRGPFIDESAKQMTALTRNIKSCIRCRMQKIRCRGDPEDIDGACLTCRDLCHRTIRKLPCLRWIITDSCIYRDQEMPCQIFSRRWQSMNIVDIQGWASADIKTIYLSQIFLNASYPVQVREFIPTEGDLTEENWMSGGVLKHHPVPRYALVDMNKHAEDLLAFIDQNVGRYIVGAVGTADVLLWETYWMAFRQSREVKTQRERDVLQNLFRLWVAIYKTSNSHHITSEEKLGAQVVDDPESPWHGKVPMPAIIIAQKECILYSKVLRPMSKKILYDLQHLVLANKKSYWLTIYLTIFILLHSCTIVTKRDEETARQYNLKSRFANPSGVIAHQVAALTMLAHFNYVNTGFRPFQLASQEETRAELANTAELDAEQLELVQKTAAWIKDRESLMKEIRDRKDYGHPYYWISQMFEENWVPGPVG